MVATTSTSLMMAMVPFVAKDMAWGGSHLVKLPGQVSQEVRSIIAKPCHQGHQERQLSITIHPMPKWRGQHPSHTHKAKQIRKVRKHPV
jgi:hypothetical protein